MASQRQKREQRKTARLVRRDDAARAGSEQTHNRRVPTLNSVGDPEMENQAVARSSVFARRNVGTLNDVPALPQGVRYHLTDSEGNLDAGTRLANHNFGNVGGTISRSQAGRGTWSDNEIANLGWDKLQSVPSNFDSTWGRVSGKPNRFDPENHTNDRHSVNYAQADHSHSTSYALRFEALPEDVREFALEMRAILADAVLDPPEGESETPLQAAQRYLLSLLLHVSLDGLTETMEERFERRREEGFAFERNVQKKTLEMYAAELREGTTRRENGVIPWEKDNPAAPVPDWQDDPLRPKYARRGEEREDVKPPGRRKKRRRK